MSYGSYYPKNWRAHGYGYHNLAALVYPEGHASHPDAITQKSSSHQHSSGGSSLYPSVPSPSAPSAPSAPSYPPSNSNLPYPKSNTNLPYPSSNTNSNLPYPTSNSNPNLPYPSSNSNLPYPTSTPYPMAPYPSSVPYPPYPMGVPYPSPSPSIGSNSSSGYSSLYPSIPSLPDSGSYVPKTPSTIYPKFGPNDDSNVSASAQPPALPPAIPEPPIQSIHVPDDENLFMLGEKASGIRSRGGDVQDFHILRNQCLSSGALFEDPEFPACDASLMFSRRPDRHVEWLRPMEICDDPQFFFEGYSRFDVQQGELGDCWLLAATANLTQESNLFFRVVPPDQDFHDNYAGIFHFRFWQYGKWIDVVIDDRLPTYNGELMYMHSTERNEFWSALLEKAYAKLHGSYEALKGGTTCEAMEDFTGGVTEMYDMQEAPPELFNILLKGYERNSMMGCSLEPDPNVLEAETPEGLIRGHAYSITRVCLMDISTPNRAGKIPMLRLRNPWGNEAEWRGPWSDQSPEWRFIPDHVKVEIGLTFDVDGEFWMSFADFMKHFDRVEICNLSPDSLTDEQKSSGKKKWEMSVFEGEWTPGVTAGGCRNYLQTFWHNPQYIITLEDPDDNDDDGKCTVIVALMQKNRRSRRNMGMDCLTIGFAIYHLTERDLMTRPQRLEYFKYHASVARSPAFINLREVSCRFKLPPGHYLIVPSTFEPNEEGEFLIRVFSEHKNHMEENDEEIGVGDIDDRVSEYDDTDGDHIKPITPNVPSPQPSIRPDPQSAALEKLFIDIAGDDMEVDWMELKRILDHSMRDELPKVPINGYPEENVGFSNVGRGAGGNGDDGGGGNLIAILCGPFCKDTQIGETLGLNEQNQQLTGIQSNQAPPITSVMGYEQGFSKDVCRSMIAMMDVDQSGKLGFEEFQTLLTDIARWKAVFKLYDRDNTGHLNAFELREALNSAGYHLNNRILNALAHRYGSRNGIITFDDFIMCAIKMKTMIDIFKERDTDGTNMATFSMDEWIEKTIYS